MNHQSWGRTQAPGLQLREAGLGEGASGRGCPTRLPTSLRAGFGELSHGRQVWASAGRSSQPRPSWWGVKGSSDSAWLWGRPTQHLLCRGSHVSTQGPSVLDPTSARKPGTWKPVIHPEPRSPHWSPGNGERVCVAHPRKFPRRLRVLDVPGTQGRPREGQQPSQALGGT